MSKIKRTIFLIIMCIAAICTSCHKQEEGLRINSTSEAEELGTDEELFGDVQYIERNSSMNGTVVLNSFAIEGLCFEDVNDGTFKFVCSKAGCEHDDAKNCVAAMLSGSFFPTWFDNKICAMSNEKIYFCNADGSNLTVCHEFEKPVYSFSNKAVRVGQTLYYTASCVEQNVDSEGYSYIEFAQTYLYMTDLKSGETRRIYAFSENFTNGVGDVFWSGSHILASVNVQLKSIQDIGYTSKEYIDIISSGDSEKFNQLMDALEIKEEYVWLNPEQDSAEPLTLDEIHENMHIIGALENSILFVNDVQKEIWKFNTESGEKSLWRSVDDGWTYEYSYGTDEGIMIMYGGENCIKYCIYSDLLSEPVCFCPPDGCTVLFVNESESKYWYSLLKFNESDAEIEKKLADKTIVFENGEIK